MIVERLVLCSFSLVLHLRPRPCFTWSLKTLLSTTLGQSGAAVFAKELVEARQLYWMFNCFVSDITIKYSEFTV